jgi:hypothetical protein
MNLPKYLDDKSSLIYVVTMENYIHQSWMIDGQIVSYENIPENYPSGSLCLFESLEEYLEAIKEVSWINDEEYIIRHKLEDHGFPFIEEEEE